MNKKDYLIKLLEALRGTWIPAEWFLVVLKAWGFEEDIIETLIQLIENAIKNTDNQIEKEKLQWWLTILTKLKEAEAESLAQDEKECEDLLTMLEQIA